MKRLFFVLAASTSIVTASSADTCPNSGSHVLDGSSSAVCETIVTNAHAHQASHLVVARPAETTAETAQADIVDTAVAAGKFTTLVAAVKAAGLVETLKGDGPFTVFAPSDAAFGKLPAGTVNELLKPENREKLKSILAYHVVAGAVKAADVVKLSGATTVQGQRVDIKVDGGNVMVDQAKVVKTDIETSNGVIHVIDSVILPSDKDIVGTAAGNPAFSTLVAAVKAAGLVETLQGEGPFTVLAPTNNAFEQLPKGTLEDLLKPENKEKLIAILTYHVLPEKIFSSDVTDGASAVTVNGGEVTASVDGDSIKIGDATVTAADIDATNGVIHVIDQVLLP